MSSISGKMSDDVAIRAGIETRVEAVCNRDVDTLMSFYATDVATFDIIAPLGNLGSESVRQRVVEWFGSFESPLRYELTDLHLEISGDMAFDHHFIHVSGTSKSGDKVDMWYRETLAYRKMQEEWKIVHQHSSVPVDPKAGKALFSEAPSKT